MEPKKNPKYDVHQKRGVLLNLGLVVSLILVITAFKWAAPIKHPRIALSHNDLSDPLVFDYPRPTDFKKVEAAKPKRIPIVVPIAPNIAEIKDRADKESPVPEIDQDAPNPYADFGELDIPKENPQPDTFRVVEKMPEPVGGWETFYKTLKKHTRYPQQAERSGTQGKVFVEFTVNDRGQLSNFKIIKGIGKGCDEEATRVLALTKWNAGKQRGRAVNVKLVQPIAFSLTPQ
jgi:protein TonB